MLRIHCIRLDILTPCLQGVRILAECSGGLGPIKAEKDPMAKEKKPNPDLWAGRTWGWKTVKSYFMLPVFHEIFGNRLKFVQVADQDSSEKDVFECRVKRVRM